MRPAGAAKNRRWVLAVLTAVLFPTILLHGTCVAVLGPGTWGSGLEEVAPEFREPTERVRALAAEFQSDRELASTSPIEYEVPREIEESGRILWSTAGSAEPVFLVEESGSKRQRLFALSGSEVAEVTIPDGFIIARPLRMGSRIVAERWRPWAIPSHQKLARYVAGWADPTLRPEVALYAIDGESDGWQFLMPGHSLAVAPNAEHAALLRSGALLAGYYGLVIWDVDSNRTETVLSLREHSEQGTGSFSLRWSRDSSALQIAGRTGGFARRGSQRGAGTEGIAINLLYLVDEQLIYDLSPRS